VSIVVITARAPVCSSAYLVCAQQWRIQQCILGGQGHERKSDF